MALFLLVPVGLRALTLEGVVIEALAGNPELRGLYDEVRAARAIPAQAGSLADPTLSYTEFITRVQTRTGPQERVVALSQAFPWPGKLSLREGIAHRNAEKAFYEYEARRRSVILDVGEAFYEYALLGEATRVTRRNLELLRQLKPVVDEKVRAGGGLGSSLRLEVELTRAEDRWQSLLVRRAAVSSRLESLLGRTPSLENPLPFPALTGRVPEVGPVSALEEALGEHPLVAGAEAGVLSAELAERLAGKAPLPDINLGANVIDIGAQGDTAVGVIVGVSLPLRFGRYRAERVEKAARASAARAGEERIRQGLRADLHGAVQGYREASKRLALYREKLLPAAEQALELTGESYRNDRATLTDLIDAERTLLELELLEREALSQAHRAALEVRTLTEPIGEPEP